MGTPTPPHLPIRKGDCHLILSPAIPVSVPPLHEILPLERVQAWWGVHGRLDVLPWSLQEVHGHSPCLIPHFLRNARKEEKAHWSCCCQQGKEGPWQSTCQRENRAIGQECRGSVWAATGGTPLHSPRKRAARRTQRRGGVLFWRILIDKGAWGNCKPCTPSLWAPCTGLNGNRWKQSRA